MNNQKPKVAVSKETKEILDSLAMGKGDTYDKIISRHIEPKAKQNEEIAE